MTVSYMELCVHSATAHESYCKGLSEPDTQAPLGSVWHKQHWTGSRRCSSSAGFSSCLPSSTDGKRSLGSKPQRLGHAQKGRHWAREKPQC